MFDISLGTANLLYTVSNSFLILGATLVLMGTVGSIWAGSVRERYAEAEQARLEAKVVYRHLSDAQKDALIQKLRASDWTSAEVIWHGTGEPESYARDLATVFERAGINTLVHTLGPFIPSAWGLNVIITENGDFSRLKRMLEEVGIAVALAETNDTLGRKDHPTPFVGTREE